MHRSSASQPLTRCLIAAIGVGAVSLAGSAVARPPLPTPCLAGSCGSSAPGFVTYGAAGATVTGSTMTVVQSSSKAILNWADFNIASGSTVNFVQPSATAAVLNKIWSADPSVIAGALNANGQVYLYNQNGIVFDKGAQVDVGSLVASTMSFTPVNGDDDALFKNGVLSNNANVGVGNTLPPVFQPCASCNPTPGTVNVNAGATLTTSDGGRIMLLGSAVMNQGTITTPGGQAILGAGNAVYLAASTDPSLRGLLIEMNSGAAGGVITNQGSISAPRGNVTLAGLIVNQDGQVSATTSVSANGSIFLVAGDTSSADSPAFDDSSVLGFGALLPNQGGRLTLAPGSITQITPDAGDTATITAQNLSNGAFNPSQLALVGQSVTLQGSAAIRAPGASVGVYAAANPYLQFGNIRAGAAGGNDGGRIYLDSGSSIDVSGLSNVPVPVTSNVVQVTLEGNDLQDDPLLRAGFLHGQAVTVNLSQGSTLFNVAPYAANVAVGVDQILTAAGSINLNSDGDVIARAGSTLNVSGGSIAYQGGFGPSTTKLRGADGKTYDISNAPNNIQYVGLANSYSNTDQTWGAQTNVNSSTYYSGYTQGANAGAINVVAPQEYLRGAMLAATVAGLYQRTPDTSPEGGAFTLGCDCKVSTTDTTSNFVAPTVQFVDSVTDSLGNGLNAGSSFPAGLTGSTLLSPTLLSQGGFNRIAVFSNAGIDLAGGSVFSIAPGPGSGLTLKTSQSIRIDRDILAPGGAIQLTAVSNGPQAQSIELGTGATIDVSGNWTNDSPLVTSAPGTTPIVVNGGSVALQAEGDVVLGDLSRIDVSGGGWVNSSNVLAVGAAGKISLNASYAAPLAAATGFIDIGAGATLIGDALGAGKGGTLSLSSGSVTIGSSTAGTPGELLLSPSFFSNQGFGQYNITGQNDVLIGNSGPSNLGSIDINPIQETRVFTQNMLLQPTGSSFSDFTRLETLPQAQRQAANISFTSTATSTGFGVADNGDVVLSPYTSIVTDPGATVSLSVTGHSGNIDVLGSIDAPAGAILLQLEGPLAVSNPNSALGYIADRQILLGPQAVLAAPAAPEVDTLDAYGYRKGAVKQGGTISLQANQGYVVTDPGSVIDVSGAAGVIDVVGSNGVTPTTLAGGAGTIAIDAREGVVLQGNLKGSAATLSDGSAVVGAAGGTLSIGLDLFDHAASSNANFSGASNPDFDPYPLNARTLTLTNEPASQIFNSLQSGTALISLATIQAGGFDNVTLKSSDVIALNGKISLSTKATLTLDAPLLQGNPGSSASFSSAYVALGSYFNQADYFSADNQGAINPSAATVLAPSCPSASACGASLAVSAQLIDIRGISALSGFTTELLASSGDIRLTTAQSPANTPPTLNTPAGDSSDASLRAALTTTGNLILQAQQVYPTTNSDFTITSASSVTVLPAAGTAATPLSAGGVLTINAPEITQQGVLRAPMGEITLQGFDATGTATAGDFPGSVTLAAGSITSVSAEGLLIPFGSTVNGQQWTYEAYAPNGLQTTNVVTAPPAKTINLNNSNVSINQGATVDLSGGGDLFAYEWIAGPGGSTDVLNPASAANNAKLKPYQYAIVPSLQSPFAPIDAQYLQGAGPGNQTIYLSGVPGLAASFYALLPAYYALLPGAFALQITKDTNLIAGSVVPQPNGAYIVSGRLGVAGTNTSDSQTSSVLIAPNSVVNTQSQYNASYANAYFSAAASAAGTVAPSLPADAGLLQISATQSLALGGIVKFATGSYVSESSTNAPITVQGAGGEVSIQASNIIIVDSGAAASAGSANGVLQIDSQTLDNLGAQTLILGASAQNTVAGEQLTVGATKTVELDNAAVTLTAPEVILAARDQVTVDPGAKLNGTGALNQTPAALVLQGGGALLVASSGAASPLQVDTSVAQNPTGVLSIGSQANLQATGNLLLYSTGNTTAQPDATIAAPALGLYSSRISLGDVPGGAAAPNGLNLTPQLLSLLSGLRNLTIGSTSTIDLYGAVNLGSPTSVDPGLSSITLDAWAVDGYGAGDKTLQANTITFTNSNLVSALPANLYIGVPTGTGALTVRAVTSDPIKPAQINLSGGAKVLNGFSAVSFDADSAIEARGSGSLAIASTNTSVPLTLQGAALTAASASNQSITTTGAVTISPPTISAASAPTTALGGALSIQGSSIAQNGDIDLPAGLITLQATAGNVVLGQGSVTSAAGASKSFVVTNVVAAAGQISLLASQGNVTVASGATLDVSGAASPDGKVQGDAGTVIVSAPEGAFTLAGVLKGGAAAGRLQGNFTLDVGSGLGGTQFSTLNSTFASSGFTGELALRTRGDSVVNIAAQDTIDASSFQLEVDQGAISVAGTIDTSGNANGGDAPNTSGGAIALWAGTGLNLQAGAQLLANAGPPGPIAINGVAAPSHGGNITLGTASGNLTINGGTAQSPTIISMQGGGDAGTDGLLTLRAPRSGDDTNIQLQVQNASNAQINTRQPVVVEGFKIYPATDLGGTDMNCGSGGSCDVADLSGVLYSQAATLMGNAAAIAGNLGLIKNIVQVRPGIEIDSAGDLVLDNTSNSSGVWDLDSWNAGLGAPVNVTLRAAGNLLFNSSLSDGFSNANGQPVAVWTFGESGAVTDSAAYRLTGGADLAAANPLAIVIQPNSTATAVGTPNSGNVIVTPSSSDNPTTIRTGDGSIAIAAGGDLLVGYTYSYDANHDLQVAQSDPLSAVIYTAGTPSVLSAAQSLLFAASASTGRNTTAVAYPTNGGNISVHTGDDILSAPSAQLVSDWLWRRGAVNPDGTLVAINKNPSWWVAFSQFDQGIGALGGGDISLNAGRNIVNVSAVIPTTGRLLGAPSDLASNANVVLTGGGHLQVKAGGDIQGGVFEDDLGNATIQAGGQLTAGTTLGQELPNLDLPATVASMAIYPVLVQGSGTFDLEARAGVALNLVANSTTLPELEAAGNAVKSFAYFYTYGPSSTLDVVSSGGDVAFYNDLSNLPIGELSSSSFGTALYQSVADNPVYPGTVNVAALSGNIDVPGINSGNGGSISLFPSASGNLSLLAQNDITGSTTQDLKSSFTLTMFETDPARWASPAAPTVSLVTISDSADLPLTPLHQADSQPITIVADAGSISPGTMTFPKPAEVIAGGDIADLTFTGKNLHPSDVTLIEAGGDIAYSTPTAPVTNVLLTNPAKIKLAGPGFLEVLAGGSLNLGDSVGILTSGSLTDSRLASAGAAIVAGAGFGRDANGGLRQPAYQAFINQYLAPDANGNPSAHASTLVSFIQQLSPVANANLSDGAAWSAFQALTPSQQLPLIAQVVSDELSATGIAHNLSGADYSRGYAAIATLFPTTDSNHNALRYSGDINLFFSQITTEQGGDINLLAPGGSVVVGLPNPPATLDALKEIGVPKVAAAANLGLLVLGEGAIQGFADQNFEVNQSRILTLEGGDIILWASNGGIDAGRGAKSASGAPPPVIQTDANGNVFVNPINDVSGSGIGQLITGPGETAGLVNLIAPKGAVNAGDAGIRVAGNLNIAAVQVIGAGNITVAGTSSGVPTSQAGALSGALSGANSLGDASKNAVDQLAQDLGGAQSYQQLTESLQPTFITVKLFCLGVECEQN